MQELAMRERKRKREGDRKRSSVAFENALRENMYVRSIIAEITIHDFYVRSIRQ